MKRKRTFALLLFSAIISSMLVGCNSQESKEEKTTEVKSQLPKESLGSADMPKIYFKENEHNFGEIIIGEIITHAYKFSNTGGADLIITDVKTSCGCTASEFPKDPIKPGETGVIKLTFDSRGREGYQNKTATIEANTLPNKVFIRLKGTIKKS
jgi:hypothetical protein